MLKGGFLIKKVIFHKDNEFSPLYIARETVLGWLAYLYPGDPTTSPQLFTLKSTWNQDHGIYLFAPFNPTSNKDFVQKVVTFLDNIENSRTAKSIIMWLTDPNADSFSRENVWFMSIKKTPTQICVTGSDFYVPFGEYIGFSVPEGCLVRYDDDAQHIRIWENTRQGLPIVFSGSRSHSDTKILGHEVYLPFIGQSCGTFRFRMLARDHDFYDNFKIGMKYYFPIGNETGVINYPLFQTSETEIRQFTFQVGLDPVNQWNQWDKHSLKKRHRTYLAFEESNPELPSYYRTHFGHEIQLMPAALYGVNETKLPYRDPEESCAKFLFSPQRNNYVSKDIPMYMLPQGFFHIKVPKVKSSDLVPIQILCGLVGTETISCLPHSDHFIGDVFDFEIGKAAYSSVFPNTDRNRHISMNKLLTNEYLTAWVSVWRFNSDDVPNLRTRYLAQPEDESLFCNSDKPKVLDYYQPTVADMTELPVHFPFVPHSGVSSDRSLQGARFELEIISAERKQVMDKLFNFQVDEQGLEVKDSELTKQIKATTPQGLLLTLDENNNNWIELLLAQNKKNPESSEFESLKFEEIPKKLRKALQTNQQFLVITDNSNLGIFRNEIPIAGWPFHINISPRRNNLSNDFRNILIFKFCKDSLFNRVKNPKLWTSPEDFNKPNELVILSSWLQDYCQKAIGEAEGGNRNLEHFSNLIQDPNWTGILALKVDMSVAKFPDELACLLGGIEDKEKLFAHHVGININRIESDSSGLKMDEVSSLFGFINYKDEDCQINIDEEMRSDYKFKVCKLEVLFKNSKLVSFNADLKLWVYYLFGNTVIGNNELIFEGTYEDHNGVPSYIFNSIGTVNINLDNTVLQGLLLSKASFRTMKVIRNDRDEIQRVNTRFSFWGRKDFAKKSPDLFSYGRESSQEATFLKELEQGAGLAFSNLGINMDFDLDTNNIGRLLSSPIFTFDVGGLSIDIGNSGKRVKSLVTGLPLQFNRFITGKGIDELVQEGYIPIILPGPGQIEKWYGLDFSLDLGKMGVLSSNNNLIASIALCWSSNSRIFLGMKIPGISQQSMLFKLQEVIDTNFKNIDLVHKDGVFVLVLRGFSQIFLGREFSPQDSGSIYLFKNPSDSTGSLGWYAAFPADEVECNEEGVVPNEGQV